MPSIRVTFGDSLDYHLQYNALCVGDDSEAPKIDHVTVTGYARPESHDLLEPAHAPIHTDRNYVGTRVFRATTLVKKPDGFEESKLFNLEVASSEGSSSGESISEDSSSETYNEEDSNPEKLDERENLEAQWTSYPLAVKWARGAAAVGRLKCEAEFYQKELRSLQGTVVPLFFGLFCAKMDGVECACLLLEWCGQVIDVSLRKSEHYRKRLVATCALHKAGVDHRQLHAGLCRHFLAADPRGRSIRIVDFSMAARHECPMENTFPLFCRQNPAVPEGCLALQDLETSFFDDIMADDDEPNQSEKQSNDDEPDQPEKQPNDDEPNQPEKQPNAGILATTVQWAYDIDLEGKFHDMKLRIGL